MAASLRNLPPQFPLPCGYQRTNLAATSMATALLTGLTQLRCAPALPRSVRVARHPYDPVQYSDSDEVLCMKVQALANLLRVSRSTLAYTGAGLSIDAGLRVLCSVASALLLNLYIYCHHTPSGIAQAAAGSKSKSVCRASTDALPTFAHFVLAALNRSNMLQGWVQQNHDGLPQKAGYRQEDINEIHGSWFDPSNPVVKYSGSLRDDLYQHMQQQAATTDLVLVVGTSLSGLNADQCASSPAKRSLKGSALGCVIISPQRTSHDPSATLRIFATADRALAALSAVMQLQLPSDTMQVCQRPATSPTPTPINFEGTCTTHVGHITQLQPSHPPLPPSMAVLPSRRKIACLCLTTSAASALRP